MKGGLKLPHPVKLALFYGIAPNYIIPNTVGSKNVIQLSD